MKSTMLLNSNGLGYDVLRSPTLTPKEPTQTICHLHKTLDVLTLFHAPSNPQSTMVLHLLRAASAHATASGITGKKPTAAFDIDVIEAPGVPTPDQLRSILEFVGSNKIGEIVKGARSASEAIKLLSEGGEVSSERVLRPMLVDWNNGRAVLGADEKAIQNLVETLPKN